MRKTLISLALAASAAISLPASAQNVVYNAFSSFHGTTATGPFAYGTYNGAAFTTFTQTGSCAIGGTICLQSGNSDVPGVYKTANGTAFQTGTVLVPNDALILHPGTDVQTYGLFNVTTAGTYSSSASFSLQDVTPSGVTVTPFQTVGGVTTFDVTQELSPNFFSGADFTSFGQLFSVGDSFGFLVGNDGNYQYDSTGFQLSVTGPAATAAVPEPATWAMMMVGFGMIGFGLRSRRKQQVRVTYA